MLAEPLVFQVIGANCCERSVPAEPPGSVRRHYAIWVDNNLRRETNRLLNAHSVKT
jgi:hypothetical protein